MKTLEEISDILSLKRRGYSERGITRKLGIHRKTVKKSTWRIRTGCIAEPTGKNENVHIGKIAGKHKFNTTLTSFALHYGFIPKVAPGLCGLA